MNDKIEKLREIYNDIERVDPTGPAWAKMKKFMAAREDEELIAFARADIKWVSQAARVELIRNRDHDAAEIYALKPIA